MSYNEFIKNLNLLENKTYSTGFDISNFYLPDRLILRNLLKEKLPTLKDSDINLMVSAAYDDEESESESVVENENLTLEERRALKAIEREERRNNKQFDKEVRRSKKEERLNNFKKEEENRKRELKKIYRNNIEQYKIEVVELKNKVRTAVFEFFNKFKEASKQLVMALVKASTSIPGAVATVISPPWNIPAAISTLVLVIVAYLEVLAKVQQIVPFFQPMRRLPILIGRSNLNKVGSILNIVTVGLNKLYDPILGLKKFVDAIIAFIKSLISPSKRRDKIFKQVTKRLVKLGHIKATRNRIVNVIEADEAKTKIHPGKGIPLARFRQSERIERFDDNKTSFKLPSIDGGSEVSIRVYSWDEEDVEEIVSLLDQFKLTNTRKWGGEQHVSGYRQDINKLLREVEDLEKNVINSDIDSLIRSNINEKEKNKNRDSDLNLNNSNNNNNNNIDDIDDIEFEKFVYDIELPDGTVIPNITEEGLEYYKNKFNVEIKN